MDPASNPRDEALVSDAATAVLDRPVGWSEGPLDHAAAPRDLGPVRSRRRPTWLRMLLGLVVFIVAGNLLIAGASLMARGRTGLVALDVAGVGNAFEVDRNLWRGAAPDLESGYESLVRAGVTTIVDLRAENDIVVPTEYLADQKIERVAIPIRDGQTPDYDQVRQFFDVMAANADGLVFVHCGAGVGRTGAMVGAYRAITQQGSAMELIVDSLAAGPPSMEQLSYIFKNSAEGLHSNGPLVTVVSRVLDAPRRIWHNLT